MNTWLPSLISGIVLPIVGAFTGYISARLSSRDVHRRVRADLDLFEALPDDFFSARRALQSRIERQIVEHSRPRRGFTHAQQVRISIVGGFLISALILSLLISETGTTERTRQIAELVFLVSWLLFFIFVMWLFYHYAVRYPLPTFGSLRRGLRAQVARQRRRRGARAMASDHEDSAPPSGA